MSPLGQLTTVVVACLACLSGTASAQSSSSTAVGAASSAGSVSASAISTALAPGTSTTSAANATEQAPGNVTVEGMVPAFANSTESALNATIQAVWSTDTARGTLTQGLTSLRDERNQTIYAVQFNETSANLNYSSTSIPWIAYVSCDSAVQTATVPVVNNANANVTSTNATAAGNQTAMSNDLLQQAQDLGAVAVLLYSSQAQSCTLNATLLSGNASASAANGTSATSMNMTLPIFSTASQQVANIISEQFGNIAQTHRYFNSTLLTASAGNLSSILADANNGSPASAVATTATDFLLARIEPTYDPTDSDNGIVATIGRAPPTASATSSGRPAATGDASQNNGQGSTTSGAGARGSRRTSKVTLAAVGFTAGALLAGVGLLL
ncbi:hypothetical protein B0A53_02895 [Rhodotorula sp. CCFEE 5036]|nr:hypothetical protein B0A53_02895 [Rhodotorula sp. CCFEE 5036]